jgi:hypothetical protein
VLEAVFVLLESPSPSRRIFIGSHSLPPLWFAVSVLQDLKDLGIRPELYAEETKMGTNLPVTATTLSKAERKEFCQFLHDLKVPSGYSSNFKRLVSAKDMKMNFNLMKSHDFHVLM